MKNKIFLIVAISLSLLFVELISNLINLRHDDPVIDIDGGFSMESRVFTPDSVNPNFLELNKNKIYSFNNQRFKLIKSSEIFRVFIVGESSVYNLFRYNEEIENKILKMKKKYKKVEVVNVGGNSYGSNRLLIIAKEIIKYSPDLVLFYMGNNEFEEMYQYDLIMPKYSWLFEIVNKSAFSQMITNWILDSKLKELNKNKINKLLERYPNIIDSRKYSYTRKQVISRMDLFYKNYEKIIRLYQESKIPLIIGTIPSNLVSPRLPSDQRSDFNYFYILYNKGDYLGAKQFSSNLLEISLGRHQASRVENSIIRDLSKKYNTPLADVELEIIKLEPHQIPGETMFIDHCHLNDYGNKVLIDTFLAKIL